jgi:ankyrin repeat protein
VIASQNPSDG